MLEADVASPPTSIVDSPDYGAAFIAVPVGLMLYYRTPVGAANPHAGGWCLKTLRIPNDLWVHYAPTPDYNEAEDEMLRTFAPRRFLVESRGAL